jgi:flagellar basal body-associated protein FliL
LKVASRLLFVMLLAIGVVALSAGVMYTAWVVLGGVPRLTRGLVSLLSWIAGFSGGTYLFWKTIERISVVKP